MPFLAPVTGPRRVIPSKQVAPHPLGLGDIIVAAFACHPNKVNITILYVPDGTKIEIKIYIAIRFNPGSFLSLIVSSAGFF